MVFGTKFMRALMLGTVISVGLVTLTVAPNVSLAQTSKGTLTGVVRDISGAVIADANVTITNVETSESRAAKTSALGAYRLDAIAPGHYILQVVATGFERYEVKSLTIAPSQTVSYDLQLKPGHVSEIISVNASEVLLNQENAAQSSTISSESLAKLPIFSLNPVETLTTAPGVQVISNSDMSEGKSIQVSGARPRANNFLIDGEEINDSNIAGQAVQPQIPDMFSDVVIYTHNAPAEFGRASGGVVNMITKSGSNTFHGSTWELYSGSGLESVDGQTRQYTPKNRADKARYNQHQYGFTAGGPIIKNKLFAFGASQWSRYYGMEQANQVTLPDANGVSLLKSLSSGSIASGTGIVATNAALLLQYLNNATYVNTFKETPGSTVTKYLGTACVSNDTVCAQGISIAKFLRPSAAIKNPDTQWTYRIDYTPWAKDTFSVRYLHDRNSLTPDFFNNGKALPGFDSDQGGPSELGQGTWTHIFSSNLLNEFRASETRLSSHFGPTAETLANPLYTAFNLDLADITELGFNQNSHQGRDEDMYQWQDTVSWTHGRHTLRAGVDIGRRIEVLLVSQNANGKLNFTTGGTGVSAEGNFLLNQLGPSGDATITYGNTRIDLHSWRSGVFAQDDIKLSPDLTVNLGLRYDYFTAPENALKYPAIDPNNPTAPIDTVIKITPDKNNIAPRVGFAYTPHANNWFADGKTVIRGGFGIFFDSDFTNIAVNSAQSAPNAIAGTLTASKVAAPNGLGNATSLIAQIPHTLSPLSSVMSVTKNLVSPYSPEWNFGVERELPGQIALSATYVGSRGIKLFANQQYNYYNYDTGERLDPSRGAINARGNFASSNYNGLEVGVRHNFSHGVTLLGSYVYSKTLDNGSEVFTTDSAATSYAADLEPGGRKYDWGNSTYDHRQYFAVSYVWSPAGLHSGNTGRDALLSAATRNWTISGASRFQSGAYSTVQISGVDTNGDGNAYNDRPLPSNKKAAMSAVGIDGSYVCNADRSACGTPGVYYDLAANNSDGSLNEVSTSSVRWLIPNGPGYLHQEIGRNSYLNPGMLFNDIALEKAVPTSLLHFDRGQFVLRAEVKNFANHNNVNLPDVNLIDVGTSSFMNIPQARSDTNRSLRFWAKFTF